MSLKLETTIWCSCNNDEHDCKYLPVKSDWHGEVIEMKCESCGHVIRVERSLQTELVGGELNSK